MKSKGVVERVEPIIERELEPVGIDVVDVQYKNQAGRWVLQVFIDKPGGVDLDTCQQASEIIGRALDWEDPIPHSYVLEVSSPGLDRVLKKDKDFERFTGKKVTVKVREPINNQKNFKGLLLGLRDGKIMVDLGDRILEVSRTEALQVRLVAEI
ncbi:MAG TPA: ribosome maturation factor RimP [Syntrophothermus lipocalidus]|nr:ribosome maturation factor RimP [Syntrophothermus lipocalidus]